MPQFWKVARIEFPPDASTAADELIATLQELLPTQGAYETILDVEKTSTLDSVRPPTWHIFFEPEDLPADLEQTIARTTAALQLFGVRLASITDLPKENWQENWRQYFQPVRISDGIEIRPSWLKPQSSVSVQSEKSVGSDGSVGSTNFTGSGKSAQPASRPTIILYIEPGMAFGTGTHATTQLCLRIAEKIIRPDTRILDAGTGSGILAIAALKLGAAHASAFDIDPDVEENLRLNLELNDLAPALLDLHIGNLDSIPLPSPETPAPFDTIFCNMLSREFLPLLPDLPRYLAPAGHLLLSGLLTTEREEVLAAATAAGLHLHDEQTDGEWTALVLSKAKPATSPVPPAPPDPSRIH